MKALHAAWLAVLLAPAAPASDADTHRAALREAHVANDGVRLETAATGLLAEFPGQPTYLFLLARAKALLAEPEEAIDVLQSIRARGVDMLPDVMDDDAFADVRAHAGFASLEASAGQLRAPIGHASTHRSFGPADTVPEAVVVAGERAWVSSVRRGSILHRDVKGGIHEWPTPGRWSAQGMKLSPDGETLWVTTSAMNVSAHVPAEERGGTAIVALDAGDGTVLARHVLGAPGPHVLGDFVFLDADTLLATDSHSRVFSLDLRTGEYTERVPAGVLRSTQGLARIGAFVFIADYGNGLYRFDPSSNAVLRISDGSASPYGIDGLYAHGNTLIAIQNGVRPQQVARFTLDEDMTRIIAHETLLANHPAFDEPTLGDVRGNTFYLVANSHWNRIGRNGELTGEDHAPPVILALPLGDQGRATAPQKHAK